MISNVKKLNGIDVSYSKSNHVPDRSPDKAFFVRASVGSIESETDKAKLNECSDNIKQIQTNISKIEDGIRSHTESIKKINTTLLDYNSVNIKSTSENTESPSKNRGSLSKNTESPSKVTTTITTTESKTTNEANQQSKPISKLFILLSFLKFFGKIVLSLLMVLCSFYIYLVLCSNDEYLPLSFKCILYFSMGAIEVLYIYWIYYSTENWVKYFFANFLFFFLQFFFFSLIIIHMFFHTTQDTKLIDKDSLNGTLINYHTDFNHFSGINSSVERFNIIKNNYPGSYYELAHHLSDKVYYEGSSKTIFSINGFNWNSVYYKNHNYDGIQYSVLYNDRSKMMALVFKGTHTDDFLTFVEDFILSFVQLHDSMVLETPLIQSVKMISKVVLNEAKSKNYKLMVAGHSLGGYMAVISGYYIYDNGFEDLVVYNFDGPGSKRTIDYIKNCKGANSVKSVEGYSGFVKNFMIIPNWINSLNYKHVGDVFLFSKDNEIDSNVNNPMNKHKLDFFEPTLDLSNLENYDILEDYPFDVISILKYQFGSNYTKSLFKSSKNDRLISFNPDDKNLQSIFKIDEGKIVRELDRLIVNYLQKLYLINNGEIILKYEPNKIINHETIRNLVNYFIKFTSPELKDQLKTIDSQKDSCPMKPTVVLELTCDLSIHYPIQGEKLLKSIQNPFYPLSNVQHSQNHKTISYAIYKSLLSQYDQNHCAITKHDISSENCFNNGCVGAITALTINVDDIKKYELNQNLQNSINGLLPNSTIVLFDIHVFNSSIYQSNYQDIYNQLTVYSMTLSSSLTIFTDSIENVEPELLKVSKLFDSINRYHNIKHKCETGSELSTLPTNIPDITIVVYDGLGHFNNYQRSMLSNGYDFKSHLFKNPSSLVYGNHNLKDIKVTISMQQNEHDDFNLIYTDNGIPTIKNNETFSFLELQGPTMFSNLKPRFHFGKYSNGNEFCEFKQVFKYAPTDVFKYSNNSIDNNNEKNSCQKSLKQTNSYFKNNQIINLFNSVPKDQFDFHCTNKKNCENFIDSYWYNTVSKQLNDQFCILYSLISADDNCKNEIESTITHRFKEEFNNLVNKELENKLLHQKKNNQFEFLQEKLNYLSTELDNNKKVYEKAEIQFNNKLEKLFGLFKDLPTKLDNNKIVVEEIKQKSIDQEIEFRHVKEENAELKIKLKNLLELFNDVTKELDNNKIVVEELKQKSIGQEIEFKHVKEENDEIKIKLQNQNHQFTELKDRSSELDNTKKSNEKLEIRLTNVNNKLENLLGLFKDISTKLDNNKIVVEELKQKSIDQEIEFKRVKEENDELKIKLQNQNNQFREFKDQSSELSNTINVNEKLLDQYNKLETEFLNFKKLYEDRHNHHKNHHKNHHHNNPVNPIDPVMPIHPINPHPYPRRA